MLSKKFEKMEIKELKEELKSRNIKDSDINGSGKEGRILKLDRIEALKTYEDNVDELCGDMNKMIISKKRSSDNDNEGHTLKKVKSRSKESSPRVEIATTKNNNNCAQMLVLKVKLYYGFYLDKDAVSSLYPKSKKLNTLQQIEHVYENIKHISGIRQKHAYFDDGTFYIIIGAYLMGLSYEIMVPNTMGSDFVVEKENRQKAEKVIKEFLKENPKFKEFIPKDVLYHEITKL